MNRHRLDQSSIHWTAIWALASAAISQPRTPADADEADVTRAARLFAISVMQYFDMAQSLERDPYTIELPDNRGGTLTVVVGNDAEGFYFDSPV